MSPLLAANLAFWDRSNPAQADVDGDVHNADDPKHLTVVLAVISENDGEYDAAEVSGGAGEAGYDSCKSFISLDTLRGGR